MKATKNNFQNLAWIWFSKFIRLRFSDKNGIVKCVTCPNIGQWKNFHAGHFISRRHQNTLYDEKNVQVQCPGCNLYNQGKQFEFGLYLDKVYGHGTAEKLLIKSKIPIHRDIFSFELIYKYYREKVEKMLKEKENEKSC